jgi:hypothetical protein
MLMVGEIEVRINRYLAPDDLYFQADGLTEEEHAKVRAAEEAAKRAGGDHKRARLMATIETGKVRVIHCGKRAAESLKKWVDGLRAGVS